MRERPRVGAYESRTNGRVEAHNARRTRTVSTVRLASVPLLVALVAAWAAGPASADTARPLTGRVLVTMAPASSPAGTGKVGPGRVTSAAATAAAAGSTVASAGGTVSGPVVPEIRLVTVRPQAGETAAQLVARLKRDPRVEAVQRERRSVPREIPNDPAMTAAERTAGTPAGTTVEWWAGAQNLPAAWDITHGTGARVAIIDTGVEASHPEFQGRIAYAADQTGLSSPRTDEGGHGTHVASLACAAADNGIGIAGAGYGCSLIVEKIDFSDASIAAAIVDAAKHGADAINMSFGTDGSVPPGQSLIDALTFARKKGAVLVAAAADEDVVEQGDPSNVLQPTGTGPDIAEGMGLSVAAAAYGGGRAWFSGRGSQISLAAYGAFGRDGGPRGLLGALPAAETDLERPDPGDPAAGIPAVPACSCRTAFNGDDRYAYLAGTSMAAPQVAAVAALMRNLNPDLPPAEVERLIKQTASRPAGTGWTNDVGWGILDGGRAVAAARDADRTAPVATVKLVRRTAAGVVVRVSGKDAGPPGVRVSGVSKIELYRTLGGRRILVAKVRKGTVSLSVAAGAKLQLTARAVDKAGNRQKLAATPQLRVRR
jgi:serine protease